LLFNEFNREQDESTKSYFLIDAPVDRLYAYQTDSGLALYVLMDLDRSKADRFMAAWGLPENVETKEEVESGDFPFLHWRFDPLDMFVTRDRFAQGAKWVIVITDMKYADLLNKDPL
jgi:hypothetical protein